MFTREYFNLHANPHGDWNPSNHYTQPNSGAIYINLDTPPHTFSDSNAAAADPNFSDRTLSR
jgi:hypothetical protein